MSIHLEYRPDITVCCALQEIVPAFFASYKALFQFLRIKGILRDVCGTNSGTYMPFDCIGKCYVVCERRSMMATKITVDAVSAKPI